MKEIGKKYEEAIEVKNQRNIYNNLCYLSEYLYLWIKATQTDIGLLLEIRIYHPTELSALSDELLNKFMEIFEKFIIFKTLELKIYLNTILIRTFRKHSNILKCLYLVSYILLF